MRKNEIQGGDLLGEIRALIEDGRKEIAVTVNAAMTMLYWQIGKRIKEEVLHDRRAEYGQQIVASLAQQLTSEYGRGWSARHLHHCLRFAETFPDIQIVNALRTQLNWTHANFFPGKNAKLLQ